MKWVVLVLLLLGCSENIAPDELRSGSRLELRYWHFLDGTRHWDSSVYFDRQLDTECTLLQRDYGPTFCQPLDGDPYQDNELVRVFRHTPTGDARIQVSMLTSEDGMQAPGRLHDTLVDGDCRVTPFADGTTRCLPTQSEQASYYADAGCSVRRLAMLGNREVPPAAVVSDPTGYCPSYFRVGHEVSKYPLYQNFGGTCMEVELPDSQLVYEIGEPVEPVLETRPIAGGTRMQTIELVDGTMRVPADELFDPQLGTTCQLRAFTEFALCLPPSISGARPNAYYRTADCQDYVNRLIIEPHPCEARPRYFETITSTTVKLRELIPTTEPLFELTGDGCMPVAPSVLATLHSWGPEVPLGTFAAAVRE